jgi:site-specific recombinase
LKNNAGGLAGNISLGFFLGTATFIGSITGLPFDIRHITFAAGSFSSALYYVIHDIELTDVVVTFFGILLIGFVNFSVSFGLAFYLACKSRDINILDSPELFSFLKVFKKVPLGFCKGSTSSAQTRRHPLIIWFEYHKHGIFAENYQFRSNLNSC